LAQTTNSSAGPGSFLGNIVVIFTNFVPFCTVANPSGSPDHCRMVVLPGWSYQRSWKSGVNFPQKNYRSIACLHSWLRWCTKPFMTRTVTFWKKIRPTHNSVDNFDLSWVMHLE
jgi:hypothetical protein